MPLQLNHKNVQNTWNAAQGLLILNPPPVVLKLNNAGIRQIQNNLNKLGIRR